MGILNIDYNNINLDNNDDEDDRDTIILVRILAYDIKFEKREALKKKDKWRINHNSIDILKAGRIFACQKTGIRTLYVWIF